jgi:hypothetical protein
VSDAIWKAPDGYVDYRDYQTLESRVRELEAERDRLKEDNIAMGKESKNAMLEVANLRAHHAALVEAAGKLVGECEAEFTLDGYWNNDGALVTRKTVKKLKAALAEEVK